jgi:hypothetical protein
VGATGPTTLPEATTPGRVTTTYASGVATEKQDRALVRLVNALPGDRLISVLADTGEAFRDIAFRSVTQYQSMNVETVNFEFFANGQSVSVPAPVSHKPLIAGQRYTLVAMPSEDGKGATVRVLRDELTPPDGKAQVRVIHAAPGAGELAVTLPGLADPLFRKLGYRTEAGFETVDPVVHTSVSISAEHSAGRALTVKDIELPAGQSVTIVVTHPAKKGLEAITFEDHLPAPPSEVTVGHH